ncbi:hypothetical protein ACFCX4_23250 [Kitasatospora sp. NPDC056327]|uniref:hypothetical protein n=1 Tax=Kitasatospora sp. NPDC056327 TaxID=3345785 RepID=UPI0035E2E5A0
MTTTPAGTRPPRWKDLLFAVILLPVFTALPLAVLQAGSAVARTTGWRCSASRTTTVLVVTGVLVLAAACLATRIARRSGYPVVAAVAAVSPFLYPGFVVVALHNL